MEGSLVERARAGDADAFAALVERSIDTVYRTALGILGDPADARDATQDAFVAAWRKLPALRDPDRFDAWLGRITVNSCRMLARKRRSVREIRLTTDFEQAPTTSADAFTTAFDHAFERLTVDQRALLLEHHLDGRSVADIGERLGIPAGTVKSRLFAARRALQRALEQERT